MFTTLFGKPRKQVDAVELHALIEHPVNALFVDVREKEEWDDGHIEGFVHIPLALFYSRLGGFSPEKTIYLLCHSGGRSKRAQDALIDAGNENVVNVTGGIAGWERAGYPIIR